MKGESTMLSVLRTGLAFALVTLLVTGCSWDNRDTGTALGAAAGGLAGHALTGGSTAGTIAGAVGGGLIGNQVAK